MTMLEVSKRVYKARDKGYQISEEEIEQLLTMHSRAGIEQKLKEIEKKVHGDDGEKTYRLTNRILPSWIQYVSQATAVLFH